MENQLHEIIRTCTCRRRSNNCWSSKLSFFSKYLQYLIKSVSSSGVEYTPITIISGLLTTTTIGSVCLILIVRLNRERDNFSTRKEKWKISISREHRIESQLASPLSKVTIILN